MHFDWSIVEGVKRRQISCSSTAPPASAAAGEAFRFWPEGAGAAAAAADDDAALQAKLAERRKLMELSRSSNDRQRYFDLSRQRASVVYNTTSRAASCVPGLPCI